MASEWPMFPMRTDDLMSTAVPPPARPVDIVRSLIVAYSRNRPHIVAERDGETSVPGSRPDEARKLRALAQQVYRSSNANLGSEEIGAFREQQRPATPGPQG